MLLTLHITGGVFSILAAGGGLHALLRRPEQRRLFTVSLPVLAAWQIISGLLLLLQGSSVVRMCTTAIVYLVIMGWVEIKLLRSTGALKKV